MSRLVNADVSEADACNVILDDVIPDNNIGAARRVSGTSLVRAVRGGNKVNARTITSGRSMLANAVLDNPVVTSNRNLLVRIRGGHVQAVQGDVAILDVRGVLRRQIPDPALRVAAVGHPVGR